MGEELYMVGSSLELDRTQGYLTVRPKEMEKKS